MRSSSPPSSSSSTLPLSAAAPSMDPSNTSNPLSSFSSFFSRHLSRVAADLSSNLSAASRLLPLRPPRPPFASASLRAPPPNSGGSRAFDLALAPDHVAGTMAGTSVYTVSNSANEFVLVSDPNDAMKSLGLLCFRQEDAQALLAQVRLRKPALGKGARVVPITLDQVYMLKVEGIAFRFLPDPIQIKNALQLKAADNSQGFDGVPVFQSDLLVIKKKNKRYCPIYFQKEDIERELSKVSRSSRAVGSSHIMVGSLEDVLKKMEMNKKNSGWEDLIFIPPGRSYTQHINEVAA